MPQKGQFSADVRCGQTAGWIKMPLGMEIGLGPGECVRWRCSSTQKGGTPASPGIFGPCYCDQMAGWMKMPPPSSASQRYDLRHRTHSLQLPQRTTHLSDSNFLTHMLYKNSY